ncbi:MAG: mechanosensitive ion channel family protein, partial [Phycisphaeraceae bacterium]|nr:mechanosensitive ion channel family protein [Phycisphaeraceae bacterium]
MRMSHGIGRIGFLPMVLGVVLVLGVVCPPPAAAQTTNPTTAEETPLESDLSSPAATMRTFRRAVQRAQELRPDARQAWEIALGCIDMSAGPSSGSTAEDAVSRRLAAQKLLDVIDRVASDPANELPDAQRAAAAELDAYVFFPQPSSAGQRRVLGKLGKSVSQPIVLVQTSPGTWKFSQRTIEGIDVLHEQMLALPVLSGGGQPVSALLGPTFDRTRTWGWLALAGAIFLGLLAGKVVATVLRNAGKRMHSHKWAGRKILFDAAAGPANLALITLGLAIGMRFIYMDGAVATLSLKVIAFLYLIAVGWYLYNLVDLISLLLGKFAERSDSKLDDMVLPLITKTLRIFLIVVFSLMAAQNVFGLDITGWLAGLGIAGLAVSLAAQDSFRNLFGSVTVFFDKPFAVGDFIRYGDQSGTIEEIGFRSTRVRLIDGAVMTVPNMKFGDDSVVNITRSP